MKTLALALLVSVVCCFAQTKRLPRDPAGGVFFYAKDTQLNNTAPAANSNVLGCWIQFFWSEIEKDNGVYDWSSIDARMKPWFDAGKKVAFRVYWIGSGNWKHPNAGTPTPASVWQEGAKFVRHEPSHTEIPLPWDPIYKARAFRFLEAVAQRYESNPNILFFDVTPGAETNPYRFLALNCQTPEFKTQYAQAKASDGRAYSDELWQTTVREWIDAADRLFTRLPLVVTLNVGTLNLDGKNKDYSIEIGDYAVAHGFYVGQNGLSGSSYTDDSPRKRAFLRWSQQTRLVFETLGDSGKPMGSLHEVVDAANRVHANYLLPYPNDVLHGTRGQDAFDPAFEEALAHAAQTLGKSK